MKQATQFLSNDNIPAINAAVAEVLRKFKTGESKGETPEEWLVELADVQRNYEMTIMTWFCWRPASGTCGTSFLTFKSFIA